MVGLLITTYNRINYLQQCVDSLKQLTTLPDIILFVDDASEEDLLSVTGELILHFNPAPPVEWLMKECNAGIRNSIWIGAQELFEKFKCEVIINIDGDAIVKPDFIEKLLALRQQHPGHIVSGFNAISDVNPIIHTGEDYCVKGFVNGINTCFDKELYEKYIKPALLKEGNWDYNTSINCREDNKPFYVTRPSCVQHIGLISSMGHGHGAKADQAYDY